MSLLGCRWIEGEDFLERAHRGGDIFCGAPVHKTGESWCTDHRARVYFTRGSARHEAELTASFAPAERATFLRLRASGLELMPAVMIVIRSRRRPPALAA